MLVLRGESTLSSGFVIVYVPTSFVSLFAVLATFWATAFSFGFSTTCAICERIGGSSDADTVLLSENSSGVGALMFSGKMTLSHYVTIAFASSETV